MNQIRAEIRNLIIVNERIQSALLGGESLNEDEQGLVKMIAGELLGLLKPCYAAPNHEFDAAQGERHTTTDVSLSPSTLALTDSATVD